MPTPRSRDGWFRVGSLDVTTTAFVCALSVFTMFVYAANRALFFRGTLFGPLVRNGELWRLVTWPAMTEPSIWLVLSILFFWFVGHYAEEIIGRRRMAILLLAATVVPASVAVLALPDSTISWGLHPLNLSLLVVLALDRPNMPFFFGVPAWIMAAVYGGIDVLRLVGERYWGTLLLSVAAVAVSAVLMRSYGTLADAPWIPRLPIASGTKQRKQKRRPARGTAGAVVTGPWASANTTNTADQAELDVLLDKISSSGMDSLTKTEKQRLNELSKRLRGR
jgi:hypothetical protein